MRPRRSLLFVCGADPRALEAAARSAADGLILDLEDTVTPERKPLARQAVADALRRPGRPGLERAVRVNAPATPWFAEDLEAAVAAGAEALVVPKVESADDLRAVERRLAAAERAAGRSDVIALLPLIETPLGILQAYPVAAACPRVEALVFGHVDLSRTLGIKEAGAMDGTLLHARCQLVLAARAAGRQAIDAVFMDLDDAAGFTAEARQGVRLGFAGKLLIDERQVRLAHEAWQPSEAEIAYARRLVAAWETALAGGRGVFVFEGRVIDLPVVEAERALLARAGGSPGADRRA
jgi:citrate lyase subunit beta/citryl-CoA lyase